MKKMKGITPIISIIILLLITIALAATAYSYLTGYLFGQITNSFSIPGNGAFCSGGTISVIVRNDSPDGNLTYSDFNVIEIDGVTPVSGVMTTLDLAPRQSGRILQVTGQASGSHEVILGTGANVITQNVYCP